MMTSRLRAGLFLVVPVMLIALGAGSCSNDNNPTTPGDTTPPNAIANLAAGNSTVSSIRLTWTATGDDGATGTAERYDIRYSNTVITAATFGSATAVTGLPAPTVSGTSQTVTVSGLAANTTYYFAMKTADNVPNWSTVSNLPSGITLQTADITSPAAVTNLATSAMTATSVQLTWMTQGDDNSSGTAAQYDFRYSTAVITAANFASAAVVTGIPAPAVSGSYQNVTVTGLAANTTYYFAMKTADEVPNWSVVSNVPSVTTLQTSDGVAPAAVGNLATGAVTANSVQLTWMAQGDDNSTGTAAQYDFRYSTAVITAANFAAATAVTGVPAPTESGTRQYVTVSGLMANTTYYFAMKTADEVPNWSTMSNSVSALTR
jgi:phosphodiesterase/alkaline phosphatase D-like protein